MAVKNSLLMNIKKSGKRYFITTVIMLFIILLMIYLCKNTVIRLLLLFVMGDIVFNTVNNFKKNNKFLRELDPIQLEKVEQELKTPFIYYQDHYSLTDHYIVDFAIPGSIITYDEILLIYKKICIGSKQIETYLYVVTKREKHKYMIDTTTTTSFNFQDFSNIIINKNPGVLIGKTKENIQILKEKYGIRLK